MKQISLLQLSLVITKFNYLIFLRLVLGFYNAYFGGYLLFLVQKVTLFLQAKIQKHQAFEAEVAAHSNAIVVLDNTGSEMISAGHFASDTIRKRLDELHRLWELLLSRLAEKGMKLQQALVLVQFLRHCSEVMFWIHDKVLCDFFPISFFILLYFKISA